VNPTCRWVTIAAACRFFGGYSIGFFGASYFNKNWPDKKNTYGFLNALVVSICGFTSAIAGGYISDASEKKGIYMSKAYVCMAGTSLAIPFVCLCYLFRGFENDDTNFYVALVSLALEYLFAECWIGPAITMIINTISPENKGFAVSAFLFFATISGTIATSTLGVLGTHFEAAENPRVYGYLLAVYVCIAYAASLPFFLVAGRSYTAVMEKREKEKKEQDALEE